MSVVLGPKLGQIINANIGDFYVDQLRNLLRALDALIFASVLNSTTTAPPNAPNNGDAYLLLGTPTGAWAGQANAIAVWSTQLTTSGTNNTYAGWEFHTPQQGWMVWNATTSSLFVYSNGAWAAFTSGVDATDVTFGPTPAGNFSVAHGLSATPSAVTVELTSGGQVWFQDARYDGTNVYLVASDEGLTGHLKVWS